MSLSIGKTLTAEQRLHKATMDIVGCPEFVALAGVFMIGKKEVKDSVPTACTNGRDEFYGRAFVDMLTDAELRFLMLHECYHKMYRHLTTWKHLWDKNKDKANQACDHVINLKLCDTDSHAKGWIVLPKGGLYNPIYRGLDAKQVWDKLPDMDNGDGGGGGGGLDDHDWEGASQMDADEADGLSKEIDEALRQGSVLAGKTGSGSDRLLSELLQPQKDWRELLREYVSAVCAGKDYSTWRKVNRRYVSADMLMPGSISENVGEIVVAIDTSGSIGQRELDLFLAEVTGICSSVTPSKVHMIYWDTGVCKHEIYLQDEASKLVDSTKPAGGGGTDVACVPTFLNTHSIKPECVIVLTDGYLGGDWGQWLSPVLWCIQNNKSAKPTVGTTVHIN